MTTFFAADRGGALSPPARSAGRALALAAVALAACTSSGNDDEQQVQMSLTIDPAAFLGDVRCSNEEGAIRSYVATLTDESAEGGPTLLASSPPIPCSSRVTFTEIVEGRSYRAEIDGYGRFAEELTPRGGETSGSREMLAGRDTVDPRWTWACSGPDEGGIVARKGVNVVFRGCSPLTADTDPQPTAIELDPTRALGALRCEADGGTVASFDIVPEDGALAPVLGITCPPEQTPTYNLDDLGVPPGRAYSFRLEARDAAGAVAFGSACVAVADEGVTAAAACDPLSATGALEIDLDALLAEEDLACGDGASVYFATVAPAGQTEAEELLIGPVPCGERAFVSPLVPGVYGASVEVLDRKGDPVRTAACDGEVRPGATTRAACAVSSP
ncbi:hypothetical protein [Sorangium cellulosum]|uniref:hypothetical protein n=1 Tax=Sorangium cellulosum TaxID=56 RepID=UPI000CF39F3F|nr:hypothetical protein [Sorangium cellulosum]